MGFGNKSLLCPSNKDMRWIEKINLYIKCCIMINNI
jgi:hypothetical protein